MDLGDDPACGVGRGGDADFADLLLSGLDGGAARHSGVHAGTAKAGGGCDGGAFVQRRGGDWRLCADRRSGRRHCHLRRAGAVAGRPGAGQRGCVSARR